MPNILLKKTVHNKPKADTTFIFYGSISNDIINAVNQRLSLLRLSSSDANKIHFQMDNFGHFVASMNDVFQKYHEEDAVVCIFDIMQELGYNFKYRYGQDVYPATDGDSSTKREVFVFTKL